MAEIKRDILQLTRAAARVILFEEQGRFEIIEDTLTDTSRWSEHHTIVIQEISTGKYFEGHYSCGLTESQDESPWEYDDPEFTEVFPKKTEVIVYE